MTDDERLNYFISKADNVKLKDDFWFNRKNQNVHVFNIASGMLIQGEEDVPYCIDKAQELVDTFYKTVIQPTTRR